MPQEEQSTRPPPVYRIQQRSLDAQTAWEVRPELLKLLYLHGPELQVDLGEVHFIDSTGLGMLMGVLKEARERNGSLRLLHPQREVRRIFQVTGLDTLFETDPHA